MNKSSAQPGRYVAEVMAGTAHQLYRMGGHPSNAQLAVVLPDGCTLATGHYRRRSFVFYRGGGDRYLRAGGREQLLLIDDRVDRIRPLRECHRLKLLSDLRFVDRIRGDPFVVAQLSQYGVGLP